MMPMFRDLASAEQRLDAYLVWLGPNSSAASKPHPRED